MADTERTRAAVLNLGADNTSGDISAQDYRDFIVSVMPAEYLTAGDFWQEPSTPNASTDRTTRGWHETSHVMLSACSFGDVLYMTESNTWGTADVADSTMNGLLGVATDSYAAAESQARILRRGLVYFSGLSARFSGQIGRPLYLQSALNGQVSVTIGTSVLVVGVVEPDGIQSTTSGKWRFDPESWAVKGV
jgi:hypothetical protein